MTRRVLGRLETGQKERAACLVIVWGLDRVKERVVPVSSITHPLVNYLILPYQ